MTETEDKTVAEIEEEIADIDDPEVLGDYLESEKAGKDRVTATGAIEERIDEVTEDDETDEEPADEVPGGDERIRVRNPETAGQHVAGYSFGPGEAKIIPNRPDVQTALRNGDLQYVGPR